jgi:hypothetical protein
MAAPPPAPPPPPQHASTPAPKPIQAYSLLTLAFTAPWPVSIVLRPCALAQYALLFRHVLLIRAAEASVNECWSAHQRCKALRGVRVLLAAAHLLRHRMHCFLRSLLFHVTAEVLEPAWRTLGRALRCAATVDAVGAAHDAFLASAMRHCFLTPVSREVLVTLVKLLHLCLLFNGQMSRTIAVHMLDGEALDERAGTTNKAGSRARELRERGAFALGGDAPSSAAPSAAASRRGSVSSAGSSSAPGAALQPEQHSERGKRNRRIDVQSQAMRGVLGQAGWSQLIVKSRDMFLTLLVELQRALEDMSRGGDEGAALLLSRLG